MYTNEQLTAMTAEQLKAAILELQAQGAVAPIDNTSAASATPESAAVSETPVQTDIENMKTAIAQFEESGAKYFPDQLTAMKQKLVEMEAAAEVKVQEVETEVKGAVDKAVTAEQTFLQKYGQAIAHGAEIILLAYIAGRLAGVL